MFCFFKNDSLVNFWSNQIGDIFCELTIKSMKWESGQIDLVLYPLLDNVPEHYEFDSEKNFIIKKKIVTQNEVVSINELDEEVVTIEEVVTYEVERTINPIVYYTKGLMIKPC